MTGEPVELLWVKGSGGDLGTLTEAGLAVLRLDRLRALVDVYPAWSARTRWSAAFDYCLHGKGGAAPSIDTAMHGLVDAPHVDHLHPDSGIALATAADGEALTKECFGDRVVWVPWRRPGFQLGLDIAAVKRSQPAGDRRASSAGTASPPGARPARSARRNSLEIIRTAEAFLAEHGKAEPFGPVVAGFEPLPDRGAAGPGRRAGPGHPRARLDRPPRRSGTSPTPTSCSTSCPAEKQQRARRARHLLPGPLPAHQGPAAGGRPPAGAPLEDVVARLRSCTPPTARSTPPTTTGTPPRTARRCAAPTRRSCWCPASACSPSARTSRPRGWPASSTSTRST